MQTGQDTPEITPTRPSPSRPHTPPAPRDAYTPRTVWQTPHGLAPTFTRLRSARGTDLSKIMRRSLRLVYRLRRVAENPLGIHPHPARGLRGFRSTLFPEAL